MVLQRRPKWRWEKKLSPQFKLLWSDKKTTMTKHHLYKRLTNYMNKASCFLIKSKRRRNEVKLSNFKRKHIKCPQFKKSLLRHQQYSPKTKNQKKNSIDWSFKTHLNDLKIQKSQSQDLLKKCPRLLLNQLNLAKQWKTSYSQTRANLPQEPIFSKTQWSLKSTLSPPHHKRNDILMTI